MYSLKSNSETAVAQAPSKPASEPALAGHFPASLSQDLSL